MNLTDNMFELKHIEKLSDRILLYIDIVAEDDVKEIYLNTYFEGLFWGTPENRFHVYTEIVNNQIVGEVLFETIDGLANNAGNNQQRLWANCRISNVSIDYAVTISVSDELLSFGHKKTFLFVCNDGNQFAFKANPQAVSTLNPIIPLNRKDILVRNISVDVDKLEFDAEISECLLTMMEEAETGGKLALAWKSTGNKQLYYFHEEQIQNNTISYALDKNEINLFNTIEMNNSLWEWVFIDVNGKEYKLVPEKKEGLEKIVLPTNDFLAELIIEEKRPLLMKASSVISFEYASISTDGSGFVMNFKKRSYDLSVVNIIAQRVNTELEYSMPFEILKEDDEETEYCVSFQFDVDEEDFNKGIYQIWVEIKDGVSVERYPLKFVRNKEIKENTYLITKHPYTVIGDHYYSCLFYNDSSNNLKVNIIPKRMRLLVHKALQSDEKIVWGFTALKEAFFEKISSVFMLAENGDRIDLECRTINEKLNYGISMEVDIPKEVMKAYGKNASFVPCICFDGREASVFIENNFYRAAVNKRETAGFSSVEYIDGEIRRVWGDYQSGVYKFGITENLNLLKEDGIWLFEEDKLCIRVEGNSIDEENNPSEFTVFLRDLLTGEEIELERELAVEDEMIFRTSLQNVKTNGYQVLAKLPQGTVSYLEMNSPSAALLSYITSKKVTPKKNADGSMTLLVEDILLFERTDRMEEFSSILDKARVEKAEGKRKIWLVGENLGLSARDNGLAFFEYCMQHRDSIEAEVYFVTKENNEDISTLEGYKENILIYDSDEHIYMDELAELYIVSHGIRDVMPSLYHDKVGKYRKNVIYLQHGVTAMKKMGINDASYGGSIKRFVVCSEQERRLLVDNKQFWDDEIIVTGFARYDKLLGADKLVQDEYIWIMPTWRDWLVKSEKEFLNSDFYKYYSQVLADEKIINELRRKKLKIVFNLHVEFEKYKCYFQQFENDVIHISDMHENSITDRIRECKLIITDYSSIVFDVVYMGKPAIFFQFDQDKYNKYRGSYVDLETELPGEVAHDSDQLIDAILRMISKDFIVEEEFANKVNNYFDYRDCNNSQRIYEEILKYREEIADEN